MESVRYGEWVDRWMGDKVNLFSDQVSELEMSQFNISKRQHLVNSIKQTINKPLHVVVKHQSPKAYVNKPTIDYSKDHSITPYLNNQQVYNVDSETSQSSVQQSQELIDQQYDDEMMNEIEMEIYQSAKRKDEQNNISDQQEEYEEEQRIDYDDGDDDDDDELSNKASAIDNNNKVIQSIGVAANRGQKKKVNTKHNSLDQQYENDSLESHKPSHTQITANKTYTPYHHNYYYQEAKIVEQDEEEPIIYPPKKQSAKETVNSQPVKKIHLHTPSNEQKPRKYLKFSIDCKLLNANINIKRVIKCVADGSTKIRQDAKYLVQLNNDKKQQKIVGNTEMIYFYKDALIDYYQALHFS